MIFKKILIAITIHSILFLFFDVVVFKSAVSVSGNQLIFTIIEWILTGFVFQLSSIPIYLSGLLSKVLTRIGLGSYLIPILSIVIYFIVVFYPFEFRFIPIEMSFYHLVTMANFVVFYVISVKIERKIKK